MQMKIPQKLIEVNLPLAAINQHAAREKSIRHGHPSTLHLWWARRPLASARAVIFAQMVNDPGDPHLRGKKNDTEIDSERQRLFDIIEKLVQWNNTTNHAVITRARQEIQNSWKQTCRLNRDHPQAKQLFNPDQLPPFHDPFAGGGALPLEAGRLGLQPHASDLNPVAVLINKAMLELPPRFARTPPVSPPPDHRRGTQPPLQHPPHPNPEQLGLTQDIRHYAQWMRDRAHQQIGTLYPPIRVTAQAKAQNPKLAHTPENTELPVIAWLWTRTVASPDPRYRSHHTPLASNFALSKDAYVQPTINGKDYEFQVRHGTPPKSAENGTRAAGRTLNFHCLLSGATITGDYIKAEGKAGRIKHRLMAIVADGGKAGRLYFPPNEEHEKAATSLNVGDDGIYDSPIPRNPQDTKVYNYGITNWGDVYTPRQLVGLNTLSALIPQAVQKCQQDARTSGMADDGLRLEDGGTGATAYGEAVGVYLSLIISRLAEVNNSLCRWKVSKTQVCGMFGRQSIAMLWDYAENNPFGNAAGGFMVSLNSLIKVLPNLPLEKTGKALQANAQEIASHPQLPQNNAVIATDPPYYDNIAYADISDFFYVWLRKNLRATYPTLFAPLQTPKKEELVALKYRHESKEAANAFFMTGMTQTMRQIREAAHPAYPVTIYYAFKQSDTKDGETYSTGWASFLEALIGAGYTVTGTWPVRTELANRQIGMNTNALASSVVLVCQKRAPNTPPLSRKNFIRQLEKELPDALNHMHKSAKYGDISPADLPQAIIGPGMAIFSRHPEVLNAAGEKMTIPAALALINQYAADSQFDPETRFAINWFQIHQWNDGPYGEAETIAGGTGASIAHMTATKMLRAAAGKVRLRLPEDYPPPTHNLPIWQSLHHIAHALENGDSAAGATANRLNPAMDEILNLAHRLYALCEKKQWHKAGGIHNAIVIQWPKITEATATQHAKGEHLL